MHSARPVLPLPLSSSRSVLGPWRRALLAPLLGVVGLAPAAAGTPGVQREPGPGSPTAGASSAADQVASNEWLAGVREQIQASEYHLSLDGQSGAFSAPNREHGLRGTWREGRLELAPRGGPRASGSGDGSGAWTFGYELRAVGRLGGSELLATAPAGREGVEEGRIEWLRGDVREWYRNDPRGIEQGFDVERRPDGPPGEPIYLEGAIDGLLAYPSEDGASVLLRTAAGKDALRLRDLVVRDDRGSEVAACFEVAPGALRILIADEGMVYPLHVDPLLTSPAWTGESNQGSAFFGAPATAGDVNGDGYSDVVVGAYSFDNGQADEGRAFVYLGSATGLATTAAWTAESNQAGSGFGVAVGSAGDVNGDGYSDVIVGAYHHDNGQTDEGRAYLYLGSASGLAAGSAWTAESNQMTAEFGSSVGTAGDVNGDGFSDVLVGAARFDNGNSDEGRAYLYLGSGSGLAASAAWTAESNQDGALFGASAATAGDVNGDGYTDVVVGAYLYDNGQTDEGRAYVYLGSASGLAASAAWTAEGDQDGLAQLGFSVATAGDVNGDGYADVIVGANRFSNGQSCEGRAFVYLGSASGLATTAAWTGESDQADAAYGSSVASAGDVNGDGYADVIVGAQAFDNGHTDEGRAYVYQGSASGLAAAAAWTAESDQGSAGFATGVAPAGDVNGDGFSDVVVGSPSYDNGETDEGRAFVYHGSASGLSATAGWTAESDQGTSGFGASAATAGDVNGDGYSDVIVSAYLFDNGQGDEGRAYLYLGSASGLATTPAWTAEGNQEGAAFGTEVATAGDVNGDGYSDVIVGAYFYDNGQSNEGRAFVYHGSASGLAAAASWTAESNQADASFGLAVGTAGDVNGDGYSDVIVGALYQDNGQTDEGRAYVYLGSASGLAATAAWTAEGNQDFAYFGQAVGTAGDVNRDGYSDVIVGAYYFDNGQTDEGRAFVYLGSASGLAASPAWTAESNQDSAYFGISAATAGDVNGDGYSDVIVGAHLYDNGQTDEGRAFVYLGSGAGLAASPAWTAESNQAGTTFAISAATAGDVNGDGYSDVVVDARSYDNGQTDEGRAFLYLGSASGLAATAAWTAEGDQDSASFAQVVASAGDVNGDGYSDVLVGALNHDNGQTDEGRDYLYYGNAGDGLDRIPRQARADGSAPIGLLGSTLTSASFRVRALGRTPFGRGKVRLEVEVKPLGTSFDGSALQTTAYTDTGAPGGGGSKVALDHLTSALPSSGAYHWRARLRTRSPYPAQTPWLSPQGNAPSEADLRRGNVDKPDLTVSLITAPAVSGEGKTFDMKDTTKNLGPGPADPSTTRVYLSLNNKWDAGDTPLAPAHGVDALAPLATMLVTTSVTIPGGWPTGTSYLIARADDAFAIAEAKETNNTKAKSIKIGPDLQESKVVAPASAAKGSMIVLTDTAKNAGGASCGPSTTKLYLSVNNKWEVTDVQLGTRAVGGLGVGATSVGSTTVTIPAGTAPGSYFLLARADADGAVVESLETNNVKAKAITITN